MSVPGGEEAARPRPLSGGLWTLFSWLRRDERASSSDSLSSAGSDRTAISFSFLTPLKYSNGITPLVLPPPGPPTDSYKKRVQDRNLRRQHDRNITLHRKYGLYRSDCSSGYDAQSLPPVRRISCDSNNIWDRERRAASECLQGRLVHVPGKRRAPQPPVRSASVEPSTTLSRRTRKRPAPQPPVKPLHKIEEDNLELPDNKAGEMNSQTNQNLNPIQHNDVSMGCKYGKYSKKDINIKEAKPRSEKSFLKQIFENKKRISSVDTTSIKILPNISELDKQAAEIIKSNKQNLVERPNNVACLNLSVCKPQGSSRSSKDEYWFCIKCLRKYDSTTSDCLYCIKKLPSNKSSEANVCIQTVNDPTLNLEKPAIEDKQKLKEMLKEMKDSLPKRQKYGPNDSPKNNTDIKKAFNKNRGLLETPTLRIGTTLNLPEETTSQQLKNSPNVVITSTPANAIDTAQSIKEHSSLHLAKDILHKRDSKFESTECSSNQLNLDKSTNVATNTTSIMGKGEKVNSPLKISSLLNPIYIPKEINQNQNTVKAGSQNDAKAKTISDKPESQIDLKNKQQNILHTVTSITTTSPVLISQISKEAVTTEDKQGLKQETSKRDRTSLFALDKTTLNNNEQNADNDRITVPKIERSSISNKITDRKISINDASEEKLNITALIPATKSNNESINHIITGILADNVSKPKIKSAAKPVVKENKNELKTQNNHKNNSIGMQTLAVNISPPTKNTSSTSSSIDTKDQHSERRQLINQLEQSIAKGNEKAAAEAAAKLAQLRLSCSVLSFSSQIISAPLINATGSTINNKPVQSNAVVTPTTPHTLIIKSEFDNANTEMKTDIKEISKKIDKNPLWTTKVSSNISTSKNDESADKIIRKSSTSIQENEHVSVKVWIEDKETTRGPINLRVPREATVGSLRQEAERSLGLASHLQRWIVGRTLCNKDCIPLATIAGDDFSAPIYLCLVEPGEGDTSKDRIEMTKDMVKNKENRDESAANVYTELVELEQRALVENTEEFECGVCMEGCARGAGAVLRECGHAFCADCLAALVRHCAEAAVACPAQGCRGALQQREVRALVPPAEYDRWLARGLAAAEGGAGAFHCRTRDCAGWALCDPGVRAFPCPVCHRTNCVPCQAIHEGQSCKEYQTKLKEASSNEGGAQTDKDTRALLDTLIERGEALECPQCRTVITKKWGCDWIKCSACKTEICWATRGRRWGPAGRGDTSAGCRCGVGGAKCHPSCGYCH